MPLFRSQVYDSMLQTLIQLTSEAIKIEGLLPKSAFSRTKDCNSRLCRTTPITVARWHSFQRHSVRPNSLRGQSINSLAVGQILVLRKLAMLKLTAIMERYCPTHRTTGWNWELPKFIRKAKTPDYKGKSSATSRSRVIFYPLQRFSLS